MEVGVSRRGRHKALGLLIAAEVGTVCKSVLIRGQVGGGGGIGTLPVCPGALAARGNVSPLQ